MDDFQYDVENLDDLIKDYIQPDQQITKISVKKLPQAGYGSVMLKLDLTLANGRGDEDDLHVVAKILPASEMMREVFNIQVTFKNEVAFYDTVLPTLENFRKENGLSGILEMFPKFYGARINLGNSEKVDEHAVMIMENLIEAGFQNVKRHVGFDQQGAEFILRDLAKFHATTIALKQQKPEEFHHKVRTTCQGHMFPETDYEVKAVRFILAEDPECTQFQHLVNAYNHRRIPEPETIFAGVSHGDLWVNNTMQQIVDGIIVKNKFIDFQIYNYRSCVSDVFFFVFTSIQLNVLQEQGVDHFFKYYHQHLVDFIGELNCDTTFFDYSNFLDEMHREASYEFSHSVNFALIIRLPIPEKLDEETVPKAEEIVKSIPHSVKEHLWFLTKECNKRGWCY